MKKSICEHCGVEIGLWTDPWGEHPEWMHAPDDGPDAYSSCRCDCGTCSEADDEPNTANCCDGEEAEPIEEVAL